jgi:hypothetical protein
MREEKTREIAAVGDTVRALRWWAGNADRPRYGTLGDIPPWREARLGADGLLRVGKNTQLLGPRTVADLVLWQKRRKLPAVVLERMFAQDFAHLRKGPTFRHLPLWMSVRLDILRACPREYRKSRDSAQRGFTWSGRPALEEFVNLFAVWEWWLR